jgi:hypothetical protein
MRRHPGRPFLHFTECQIIEPDDVYASRKLLKCTTKFRRPVSFNRGLSYHHRYVGGLRQQLQDVGHIGGKIEIQKHTGIVLGARRAGNATDIGSKNQHRRCWKQARSIPLQEECCRSTNRHDQIG